jgi:hypothetical protein
MVELLPGQTLAIEKFYRLSDQKDALIRKLERNEDKYRAIVYRRLIESVDRRIKLIATDLPM